MNDDTSKAGKLADMAFSNALSEMGKEHLTASADKTIDELVAAFEDAVHRDDDGTEFWTARDLSRLLEYADYRNFLTIVERAKQACRTTGHEPEDHFVDATVMIEIGRGAEREVEDIHVTRYAAYLVAQNGDPRKQPVAFAQTYFAIQTRKQELAEEEEAQYLPLSEDQKRVLLREEMKEHNKNLASAAKGAGVVLPIDYAIFQSYGYKGMYGGLDRLGIQRKKGLRAKEPLLDHMGSTELAANLFRATQTEEKLRREKTRGKDAANNAHFNVGQRVRKAIRDIGGTMPENLPLAEDVAKVARRLKKGITSPSKKIR